MTTGAAGDGAAAGVASDDGVAVSSAADLAMTVDYGRVSFFFSRAGDAPCQLTHPSTWKPVPLKISMILFTKYQTCSWSPSISDLSLMWFGQLHQIRAFLDELCPCGAVLLDGLLVSRLLREARPQHLHACLHGLNVVLELAVDLLCQLLVLDF